MSVHRLKDAVNNANIPVIALKCCEKREHLHSRFFLFGENDFMWSLNCLK
jgi:hypothetical protein